MILAEMVDAHCHIDLYQDPHIVALEAERNRVFTLAVTRLPSHFPDAQRHLSGFRFVRPALGFHPMLVAEHFDEISNFTSLVASTRYIGEVGLDFTTAKPEERQRQIDAFECILSSVRGQDKVFTIHSRRAEARTLELLVEYECRRSIFHWYSGSLSTLLKVIGQGYYLSVNHQMLKSKSGQRLIQAVPIDRVLTETDGPFIKIDKRVIQPTDVKLTEIALAELWGMDQQQVSQVILSNFRRLLI